MTLKAIQKEKIIAALLEHRRNWDGSDAEFSRMYGLNPAQYSRLKKGDTERVVGDDKLVSIGRKLGVHWRDTAPWKIVETDVYLYITEQLKYCQDNSIARIYCDAADCGKTTSAKEYMLRNKNVFYLDCSQNKTRTQMARAMARLVGVNSSGNIKDVIADTIYMLQSIDRPLIILDEAGDLSYEAWLEIKAYWNALEGYCGWYMMGADGLKKKVENNVRCEKVGYAEIFRRFGSQYMSVVNRVNPAERKMFYNEQALRVANANLPSGSNAMLFIKNRGIQSLTRLKEDIQKLKNSNLLPLETTQA